MSAREDAFALVEAALEHHRAGRLGEAEQLYHRALEQQPENADALHLLGLIAYQRGNQEDALQLIGMAVERQPANPGFLSNLGEVYRVLGRFAEAAAVLRRALAAKPDFPEAHNNLGLVLVALGQASQAVESYRRALELKDDYHVAHNNFGIALAELGRWQEAEEHYRRCLALNADYAEAHNNLGILLVALKRAEEGVVHLRRAIALRPDYAEAHNNLGGALAAIRQLHDAIDSHRRALALRPDYAEAHNNLALALAELQRSDEAQRHYARALALRPDYPEAKLNLATLKLSLGEYREGWELYEARCDPRQPETVVVPPGVAFPQWRGEDLRGKSVLLWREQGFGDEIQFARYVPLLRRHGVASVTLACRPPNRRLLQTLAGVDRLIADDEPGGLPAHDYWSYLLSLPRHLGTDLRSVPAELPYLGAISADLEAWRARLPQAGFRVGLVWKGRPGHRNDLKRSLPDLSVLRALWSVPGASFVSLQKGVDEDVRPPDDQPLVNLGKEARDFADTAAIVSQLDLVICIDSAVAHLAGALAKRCWVLLPFCGCDWRWLLERTDSPWYPGVMRLFRQQGEASWRETIDRVAEALDALVRGPAARSA